MSVTCGFYNSLNGDRKYNTVEVSQLFDGIIRDGVFMSIDDALIVKTGEEQMEVVVGPGRAWFNHSWTLNDTELPLLLEPSEVVLNRIDAVILEVDGREEVRNNTIKIVKGVPSSVASRPALIKDDGLYQYPLAYIDVPASATAITNSSITNMVGTSECPFVTGILDTIEIDALIRQWETDWSEFKNAQEQGFLQWFETIKDVLSGDVAGNLQLEIDELKTKNEYFGEIAVSASDYNNSLQTLLNSHIQTTTGKIAKKGDQLKVICSELKREEIWMYISAAKGWILFATSQHFTPNTHVIHGMLASGWRGNVYSFEGSYPSTRYDLRATPDKSCTKEQYYAWCDAKILGSATDNTLTALGDIPKINIPIILKLEAK